MVAAFDVLGITTECVTDLWQQKPRRALLARFSSPWESASWALFGGGFGQARGYVCCEVRNEDLPLGVDPTQLLSERLHGLSSKLGASGPSSPTLVGTMTSANVSSYACGHANDTDTTACALVTVGLANALRVGERYNGPLRRYLPDTINLACWVDQPLTDEAKLEALSIVAQARTLEVLQARLPSLDESGWATGTGTDCIAMFSPVPAPARQREIYAGMHTPLGRVVGCSVRQAMRTAIDTWRKQVLA